ncbi:MAG: glycine zipper 2TM domain-containing protein [Pseudomonadota bacterium]|nr:glycine zipper 2TM domain-containing protein [Pseudomonadota bacterium]
MKKVALAVGTIFTALAPAAFAQYYSGDDNRNRDYRDGRDNRREFARVIESRPLHETANRRDECWNPRAGHFEEVRGDNKTRIGKGAAIGAVAGGVLGHQVDSGGGTAVGAILGGILGHHLERRNDSNDAQNDLDFSRCRVVSDGGSSNIVGYDVRYEYNGREYVTRMDREPGRRLRLGEEVNHDGTPLNTSNYATPAAPAYSWR